MAPEFLRPQLILDTHVVLDWLYFCDPRASTLGETVRSGRARWVATPAMEAELRHVLSRDVGRRGRDAAGATLAGWQRWAEIVDLYEPTAPRALRCTDPDDQKFLDLGWRLRGAMLLSADRAVLRLARPAAREGLTILRLDDWTRRVVAER